MTDRLTRRAVVLASAAFILTACARKPRRSVYTDPGSWAPGETQPIAAPPRASVPAADQAGIWYEVKAGDTVHSIGKRSGLTPDDIRLANKLPGYGLKPGMRLWLPGVESIAPATRETVEVEVEDTPASGTYELVPRSKWTKVRVGKNNNPMNGVARLTLHHTGEHAGMAGLAETDVIRRIESYHRNGRHWAAIGYHYLVGKNGHVYEGRPIQYQGAHVSGANEHSVGISVIGDFMRQPPRDRQLTALRAFLDDQRVRFKLSRAKVFGHRDLGASECPGDALYAWLGRYKAGRA